MSVIPFVLELSPLAWSTGAFDSDVETLLTQADEDLLDAADSIVAGFAEDFGRSRVYGLALYPETQVSEAQVAAVAQLLSAQNLNFHFTPTSEAAVVAVPDPTSTPADGVFAGVNWGGAYSLSWEEESGGDWLPVVGSEDENPLSEPGDGVYRAVVVLHHDGSDSTITSNSVTLAYE